MAVRGCGTRISGGIYLTILLGPNGRAVEDFLIDPPQPREPDALALQGVTKRGVHAWTDARGVTHVIDWVSSADYPNVADFVEEVRRLGLSRRVARTFPFHLLGPKSRLCLLHDRGWVGNAADYRAAGRDWDCPTGAHAAYSDPACCNVWYHDLDPKTCELVLDPTLPEGTAERAMPAFAYRALRRPAGVTPSYQPAYFARFPITRLAVVRDGEGGAHKAAYAAARKAGVVVTLEDE